jgi:hypothetical protein
MKGVMANIGAQLDSVPGLDVDRLNAVRERVAFRD